MLLLSRELERLEKEEKEKEKEVKRRAERKNRDAFKELVQRHLKEGTLHAKLKWKVSRTPVPLWNSLPILRQSVFAYQNCCLCISETPFTRYEGKAEA
jgi:hypothetical protein